MRILMKAIPCLVSLLVVSTVATSLYAEEKPKEQKKTDPHTTTCST